MKMITKKVTQILLVGQWNVAIVDIFLNLRLVNICIMKKNLYHLSVHINYS